MESNRQIRHVGPVNSLSCCTVTLETPLVVRDQRRPVVIHLHQERRRLYNVAMAPGSSGLAERCRGLWYRGSLPRIMSSGRIILITMPYDQADIVEDFLDWHLELGVDLILALDGGSTDGTRDILTRYARTKPVVWFALPERDMTKYSIADELTAVARDRYAADWILYVDVDEFVCTHGKDLRTVLA